MGHQEKWAADDGPHAEKAQALVRPLVLTWLALMGISTVTLLLSFPPLGRWEMPVALLLAALKASLVVLFFMHLWWQGWPSRIAVLVSVLLLAVLVAFMAADVATRAPPPFLPPESPRS